MKKIILLVALMLGLTQTHVQAEGALTLKETMSSAYRSQRIYGVNPLQDGEHYAQISADGKRIVKYSYKTGKEEGTIFNVETARNHKLKSVEGYIMSPDESRILIQTETKSIYRHSFTAQFYIYTVKNNTLEPLSENGAQQQPIFSPDGNCVAFVRDNNLFLVKLLFNNSESQVTTDGKFNEVLNGIPDWVNEEEFGYARAYDFSADSQMLAYIRFDESNVKMFSFPLYKGLAPEQSIYSDYPGEYSYKYPKAGFDNSKVSVHTFDIKSHVTRKMDLPLEEDGYIPRIQFTQQADQLAIVTLNRHQNRFDLYMANPRSTVCRLILRDEAPQYIKESAYENLTFYKNHFVLMSERDGYNHLYLYTLNGNLVKQVTKGNYEVTAFYGWDETTNTFYYGSNEESPLREAVYKLDAKGRKTKLSQQVGVNNAIFSSNLHYYMNTYSALNVPPVYTLNDNTGKTLSTLIDNAELKQKRNQTGMATRELFSFTTSEGVTLNGWMVKPANFNPSKKYPVIMFQYSGPGSQQVHDSWNNGARREGCMFESYLAQEGFISVCVDGRGTGGRGSDFEKCTYLQLGVKEAHDQVEAAQYLASLPYVKKESIGIWGWSFGGYNTLMSLTEGTPVFAAGLAVAPPTNWKFYDSIYTERFMRTPKENGEGYELSSPTSRINRLHGDLMLIHGLADDNVHFQNTAEFSEALVQANIPFQMHVYTNRNHSIYGGNTSLHLYSMIERFFKAHL
jgi:dipeptidyl-peptidase-4